ncbi:MAG: DUF72 domain-containing protein [Aridibacter sp.]
MTAEKNKSKIQNPKSKIQVGCQGWNYSDWISKAGGNTIFYPRGTKSDAMLELYAGIFDTIEVDSTFYAIPPISVIENWYKKTPQDFTFSLKMPQEITHEKELRSESFEVSQIFCERIKDLKEKLATVLIQLPPTFDGSKSNAQNLREFLKQLPGDINFAIEFRHRDWMIDWTFEELQQNNIALCLCEGSWIPREMFFKALHEIQNDFAYVRFMGERDLTSFDKIYRNQDTLLEIWKEQIEDIKAKKVYVYFSNFFEGNAPISSNKLKELLDQKTIHPSILINQGSLF